MSSYIFLYMIVGILHLKTKQVFKGKGLNRAVNFAWWYFLIGTVPGMLITYGSFQVSLAMTALWAGVGFLEVAAAGWIFDRFNR